MRYWRDLSKAEKKVVLKWKILQYKKEDRKFIDASDVADHACIELGNAFYPEKGDEVISMKIKGKKAKIKCLQ